MFDFIRARKQVLEKLNITDAGTYTDAISTRNKTHNRDAITDLGYDAGVMVLRAIAETPASEYRTPLISTEPVKHGALLPEHVGKVAFVEIQAFTGATFRRGEQRPLARIESYRENSLNLFDAAAHDQPDSTLAGYYDIWENKIYFTGLACRVGIANVKREDVYTAGAVSPAVVSKIPDALEPVVVKLWLGLCPKAGEGVITKSIADAYLAAGMQDLYELKGGKARGYREVSEPKPSSGVQS